MISSVAASIGPQRRRDVLWECPGGEVEHVAAVDDMRTDAERCDQELSWNRPDAAASAAPAPTVPQMFLEHVTIVVDDQDEAIEFFVGVLGFDLVEDVPSTTTDGRPKRWVVVRPAGARTGILLARADSDEQRAVVGRQVAARVGFFLRVEDFGAAHEQLSAAGVEFVREPRDEPYGRVAVFLDVAGNRWDLLGPASDAAAHAAGD